LHAVKGNAQGDQVQHDAAQTHIDEGAFVFLHFQFDQSPDRAGRSIKGQVEVDFYEPKLSQAVMACFAINTLKHPLRLAVETSQDTPSTLGVECKAREFRRVDVVAIQPMH